MAYLVSGLVEVELESTEFVKAGPESTTLVEVQLESTGLGSSKCLILCRVFEANVIEAQGCGYTDIFEVALLDLVQKVLQLFDVLGKIVLAAEAGSGCQIKTTASYPSDNVAWLDALSSGL